MNEKLYFCGRKIKNTTMSKKYEIPDNEPVMANDATLSYSPTPLHLDITLADNAMVADIKQAIKMIKGIASVRVVNAVKEKSSAADPFAELDTSWGGDRDANEIADELHAMRCDARMAETW